MAYSAIPIVGGGGGSDGRRILNTWTVPAGHPFGAGNVVLYKGGTTGFALGRANDLGNAQTVGVVEKTLTESIRVVYQGEIDFEGSALDIDDGSTSLTAGTVYYLSGTNPGYLTPVRPFDGSSFVQGMLVATDTDKGIVINSLPSSSSSASLFSPVGSILPWSGSYSNIPATWRICDGAAVRKASVTPLDGQDYSQLYSVVGDKYKVTGLVSSTTGPVGNTARDIIISFANEGHEDYGGPTAHGLVDAYSNDTNLDFKIGWGGTNDYAIGTLTGASTSQVRFQYKRAYPGCTPVNFSGAVASTLVTIQSLMVGEASGATTDRFFIPDLRARTVFGAGYSTGLNLLNRGDMAGDDTHLLASNEIPDHDNYLYTTQSSSSGPINRVAVAAAQRTVDVNQTSTYSAGFTADNEAFSLMPPYVATNWIIRHRPFEGPGIEIGPEGPRGNTGDRGPTGCSIYVVSNTKSGLCTTLVLGYTGENCSGATFSVVACDGEDGETGPEGPTGPMGEKGEKGDQGLQGDPCICENSGNPLTQSVWLGENTPYKNGIVGNPTKTILSSQLSTDPLYPTDFSYAMNALKAQNIAPSMNAPFYYRDPTDSVNESTFQYGRFTRPLTTSTNPNVSINRSTVYSLSVINDSAAALASPFDIVLKKGVYSLNQPWFNYIDRDLYIRGEPGSLITQTVSGVTFLPLYTALGATDTTRFALQVNIGTAQSMVAATGSAVRFLPPLALISGTTASNGISSGFDGLTSGTGGLMNMLVGGHEVVGISGQYFTVNVTNEGGMTFGNLLNQTFTNYINSVDVYGVTIHTTSPNGALFTGRNTRTHVGDWMVGGTQSAGIAFINKAMTASVNDASITPFITGGAFSNAIAMQTDGGGIKARDCTFIKYPVAAHGTNGGTITMKHCTVSDSYYGLALDGAANAEVGGSIFSRNSFPMISDGAGAMNVTRDMDKIGKTHIKGNRAPIALMNTNASLGDTDINGPGIIAVNSNVRIKDFVRILSDTGFAKGVTTGVQQGTEENKFAVLAINSNISSPDLLETTALSKGLTGRDFVTGQQVPRFVGKGRVQAINSKVVMTVGKTDLSVIVDTATPEEIIKGDLDQIPI